MFPSSTSQIPSYRPGSRTTKTRSSCDSEESYPIFLIKTAPEIYRKHITINRKGETVMYVRALNAIYGIMKAACRNMSGQALMGRPAARLETMGFFDKLLCIGRCFNKRRVLSQYGCNLLIYVTPRTNISSQESYQSIISRTISTIVLLTPLFQQNHPTDTIVQVGSSHINCFKYINFYLSIRYNRIIYKLCLFPNSPKYLVSDHNISKIRQRM